MYSYPIKIVTASNGDILQAFSPELKCNLIIAEETLSTAQLFNAIKILKSKIEAILQQQTDENLPFIIPKKLKYYSQENSGDNSIWIKVYVNFKPSRGKMEKILPILGHVANVFALITGSLISLAAIAVTVGSENEAAIPLGITGGIFNLLVIGMMYLFSDATMLLKSAGRWIDNRFRKKHHSIDNYDLDDSIQNQMLETEGNRSNSTKAIITGIGCGALVLTNALITNIKTYQETRLLGIEYDHQYPLPTWTTDTIIWTFLVSATIANSAFQLSFVLHAAELVRHRQSKKPIIVENPNETANTNSDDGSAPLINSK